MQPKLLPMRHVQVTLHSPMASTRLTTIHTVWLVRCLLQLSVSLRQFKLVTNPTSKRNLWISACYHYLLKSQPSQRWISIGMGSSRSKTARKQSMASPHWQNSVPAILVISHGNANTKRLFSHIGLKKTTTKHRNRQALNSLLTVQLQCSEKII